MLTELSGLRPRIGVRGKLYAGMTGGGGAVSGTGNHKGCPYDGLAGGYFLRNDRVAVARYRS